MSLAVLLAPLILIMPAAEQSPAEDTSDRSAQLTQQPSASLMQGTMAEGIALSFRVQGANQVRIEQHSTIRVAPRPSTVRPELLRERRRAPRIVERGVGRCLPVDRLAGVQVESGNRVILYLRDRRVIRAELERSCRARDFYSGFYLSASDDGKVCVGRDTLLSRSGANCKLTRIRQLIEE